MNALARIRSRLEAGELGALPVVLGLVIIAVVFQSANPAFLSPDNLVNLSLQCAAVGTIAVGIVLVLLLGQIDLSVGSVSGLAAAILGVGLTRYGWPLPVAIAAAVAAGALAGIAYGVLFTRFGVPSFIVTLAGLLGVLGLQLWVLGPQGSINLPYDSWIVILAQQTFLPPWLDYVLSGLAVAAYGFFALRNARRREQAGLPAVARAEILVRAVLLLVLLVAVSAYLSLDRGVGVTFLLFVLLVAGVDLVLRRTRWGRSVFAVGGSVEAARRAGIAVDRVYVSVFVLCGMLAALGGLLAAARLTSASLSSGAGETNLNAIAAAVIGGTSLFGGRGSAYSALLGIVVIQSISSGLTLLSLDSSVRYMITGAVLVLAVVVDSISRRSRAAHGRA
ncbi:sugar ABC transporter permease [Microbacteriaceae bacterium VKM Ac-2854]|nr:sugar ABC transporter permease [Microbacteriaceae bacterium VKM Ac-2854]